MRRARRPASTTTTPTPATTSATPWPRASPSTWRSASGKLAFDAPGDDLLCGTADKYEIAQSDSPITGANFGAADAVAGAPAPGEAGDRLQVTLPASPKRYLAVRALDDQGNVGRTATIDTRPPGFAGGGPSAPGGSGPAAVARARRCLPRRLRVTARRIGPVRLGARVASPKARYRASTRGSVTRFCVRGGGRVSVLSRRGRIALITTTAKGHRTRQTGPGRRLSRRGVRGARRRSRGLLVGTSGGGRILYGVRGRRISYLGVTSRSRARNRRALARSLDRLGPR